MTERELLESAARAAGINGMYCDGDAAKGIDTGRAVWCPLDDDGDALRLAMHLGLAVDIRPVLPGIRSVGRTVVSSHFPVLCYEDHHAGAGRATRLAIVRTAAELARAGRCE